MKLTPTGYKTPDSIKPYLKESSKTNAAAIIFLAFLDHVSIWAPSAIIYCYKSSIDTYVIISLLSIFMLFSCRSLRGLECIVHDGSHYNFVRKNKIVNDFFTNVISAYTVFCTVNNYRNSHTKHHSYLATNSDPDFIRHNKLQLCNLNRNNKVEFFLHITKKLYSYIPSWWVAIGTDKITILKGVIWHLLFVSIIYMPFMSIIDIFIVWLIAFFIPFSIFLPILRFIGEASEHDYDKHESIAVKTFSNTGFWHRYFFHPHNDGYHTLHHLFPSIPHFRLPKIHDKILYIDKDGYKAILRERKTIFTQT